MLYNKGSIVSKDGTAIGYKAAGAGPSAILVHGGMMSSRNFSELGRYLSEEFTVYIPDRRGRGMSSEGKTGYGLAREAEDIQALAKHTGTENVFGLSSGAIIAMQAALIEPSIRRLAIYEPPLPFDDGPKRWVPAFEQALNRGDHGAAMCAVLKGTGDKGIMSFIPGFLLTMLFRLAVKGQQNTNEDAVPVRQLIEAMRYDIQIVNDAVTLLQQYQHIKADVLLMSGTKSIGYLRATIDRLATDLPSAKRVIFAGTGHIAADNSGQPEKVARELELFFRN